MSFSLLVVALFKLCRILWVIYSPLKCVEPVICKGKRGRGRLLEDRSGCGGCGRWARLSCIITASLVWRLVAWSDAATTWFVK